MDANYRSISENINNGTFGLSPNNLSIVYLYPNLKRKAVGQFFEAAEEHKKYDKYGKEL